MLTGFKLSCENREEIYMKKAKFYKIAVAAVAIAEEAPEATAAGAASPR